MTNLYTKAGDIDILDRTPSKWWDNPSDYGLGASITINYEDGRVARNSSNALFVS